MAGGRRSGLPLYGQVVLALGAGVALALWSPAAGQAVKPLGDWFIQLVRMVIAPVIFLSLTTGIAGMRDLGAVRRVAARALVYFAAVSTLALITGLVVAHTLAPGRGFHVALASLDAGKVGDYVARAHDTTLTGFVSAMIPETLVSALTQGNVLQVLVVAILTGVALASLGERCAGLLALLGEANALVFRVVALVMRAAPLGAFGAIGYTVGKFGLAALAHLAALVAAVYLTSALFIAVVLGLIAALTGFSLWRLLCYLRDELVLVFATSSSESGLPGLMTKLEAAGVPRGVVGLVVPAGYSFNLDGTNIYLTLSALFIAQACDVPLSLGQEALLLGVAMLSSKGAAGVTGAGFVTLAATLAIVPSVPLAGIALILGVDRFLSECRSLTNFIGNAVAALVVARWDGSLDRTALARALG